MLLLLLHILAATIWTGGHIVLSVVILPTVLKERAPEKLLNFESVYEKIGMPALIVQVVTGLLLAHRMPGSRPVVQYVDVPLISATPGSNADNITRIKC